jgi:FlaA1/EpsC-like NDP-sugar epimerase
VQLRRHTLPLLLIDLLLVTLAWWAAFWLRFNLDIPAEFAGLPLASTPWVLTAFAVGLLSTGVYRQVWRSIGLHELR